MSDYLQTVSLCGRTCASEAAHEGRCVPLSRTISSVASDRDIAAMNNVVSYAGKEKKEKKKLKNLKNYKKEDIGRFHALQLWLAVDYFVTVMLWG